MLTSLRNRLDVATMRSAGIAACLVKPPRQARLYDALVKVMAAATPSGAHEPARLAAGFRSPSNATQSPVPLRILLAEDNLVNQRLAVRQLRRLGHTADAVANGRQVLAALQQHVYDVLLLDCQMPELDGYETARTIRKQEVPLSSSAGPIRRPLRIIAMTANTMEGDRERCVAAGMDDYIPKPVRLPDLEAALQRATETLAADSTPSPPSPETAVEPAEETLDLSMLRSLSELNVPGESDAATEMAELFLRNAAPLRDRMREAAAAGDLADFARAAHSLKGSAGGLGARRLSRLCADLEKLAKTGDLAGVRRDVAELDSEFQKVDQALTSAAGLPKSSGS
jgi:CheY-like chemotaxis protein/HPt (histidine-containing phosphotransfer) domain-containing protein